MGARQFRVSPGRTVSRCVVAAMLAACVGWQHAAVVAAQAIAHARTHAAADAGHHEAQCRCGSGANAMCPMHKHSGSHHSAPSDHLCTGCDHPTPVVVSASASDIGSLPAERFQARPPVECLARLVVEVSPLADAGHRPAVPPPRS